MLAFLFVTSGMAADAAGLDAATLREKTGLQGGLVVVAGVKDAALLQSLGADGHWLVQAWVADDATVDALRTLLTTLTAFALAAFATAAEKSSVRRLLAVIVAVGIIGSPASAPAQDSPDPLAGEWSVEWFQKQQDDAKKWEPFWRGRCERLREMWRAEAEARRKEELWGWLSEAIVNNGGGGEGDEFDSLVDR